MTLHIFNPEHDIALASGLPNFTAPKAGRGMRHDLWWLPKLWIADGDIVLEDKNTIQGHLSEITNVEVWGWDSTIRHELLRLGIKAVLLPSEEQISRIRELSNRSLAVELLKELREIEGTIGESNICTSLTEVEVKLKEWQHLVVKAPWSSSGRGVRYLDSGAQNLINSERWIEKTILQQGSVIVERKCEKVHDFAVEFMTKEERVKAVGLSWFDTSDTAYTGNLLATEEEKLRLIGEHISLELLAKVTDKLEQRLTPLLKGVYEGPLGVDMMICENGLLNPCIELNLRRTMGHVALELSKTKRGTMSIQYKDHKYQLIITNQTK